MQPNTPECSVGLPIWCENTPTLTSTAFPLAPYLLRELMNFSLARLLTSFKVPSSGLLHLLTPVAGVCCSPERKQVEKFLRLLVESEFLLPFRGQSIGAKELLLHFWENNFRVKLYREHRLDTEIVFPEMDGKTVTFPSKAPFHYKLYL